MNYRQPEPSQNLKIIVESSCIWDFMSPEKLDTPKQTELSYLPHSIFSSYKWKKSIRLYCVNKFVSCWAVSYTHLRAHETEADLVCRLLLEKKNHFFSFPSFLSILFIVAILYISYVLSFMWTIRLTRVYGKWNGILMVAIMARFIMKIL